MSRKWYQIGSSGRDFLRSNKMEAATLQEGFPGNGIEFLCMHRAMIEHLNERFGFVPVTNDQDRRGTFSQVLQGWQTDAEVTRALLQIGGDTATFQDGLETVNDVASFRSEDDFANYLQTLTRPGTVQPGSTMTSDGTPAKRACSQDKRPGAGVHNWLHGEFAEGGSSPIDVGDAKLNLGNIVFWRIHGWIEAKWIAFERAYRRTAPEQATYDSLMLAFRRNMAERGPPPAVVPSVVSQNIKPVVLSNVVDCSRLTPHSVTEQCPMGRTDVQTTPRVNNGTVCIHGTAELKQAQNVLIQRGHLPPFVNGHPSNDGVWGPSSQEALNRWLQLNSLKQDRNCLTNAIFDMLKILHIPNHVDDAPGVDETADDDERVTVDVAVVGIPRSFGLCHDFTGKTGTCYDINMTPCTEGEFRRGFCPGGWNIQCCFN
jgi:hypothetical protein